jgi:allophanate hydrolase subunit 2
MLRFVPGPHYACFAPTTTQALTKPLRVGQNSNRMGYRLEGLRLSLAAPCTIPSRGVIPGVIQVPPDGSPILLMPDAQTTGGYPILGVVIAPDLPLAAQLLPGDELYLAPTTLAAALSARREIATWYTTMPEHDELLFQMALAGSLG